MNIQLTNEQDQQIQVRLEREAKADRPEFSEALHARIMWAVADRSEVTSKQELAPLPSRSMSKYASIYSAAAACLVLVVMATGWLATPEQTASQPSTELGEMSGLLASDLGKDLLEGDWIDSALEELEALTMLQQLDASDEQLVQAQTNVPTGDAELGAEQWVYLSQDLGFLTEAIIDPLDETDIE